MSLKVKIYGGNKLKGRIAISGSKNAALPILAATLLTKNKVYLHNVPDISDTRVMLQILSNLGSQYSSSGQCTLETASSNRILTIENNNISNKIAPLNLVSKMRASVLVLGPLLACYGEAKVALPGGCAIGSRPIDMHLDGLKQMGAKVKIEDGYIIAHADKLVGTEINFKKASVGATENIAMAASLAEGTTIINNAAKEPEVINLLQFLTGIGAKIKGIGTNRLEITGVNELHNTQYHHRIIGDRIEAATYAIAAAITNGNITLEGIEEELMQDVWHVLRSAGISLQTVGNHLEVKLSPEGIKPISIETNPYPGFPTDVQAQLMTLLMKASGKSKITETIYENRFMHVAELRKMGADIDLEANTAIINGLSKMNSAEVNATDLRASAALVLAALSSTSENEVIIHNVHHIERGYDSIFIKLAACGAKISVDNGNGFEELSK